MKDLLPTLRDMGALKMISVVKEVGMKNALYTGNFTIFCPLNSALEMYLEDYEFHKDNEIIGNYHFGNLEKKKKLREMIKRHMVSGFLKVDDFRDKQKLETRNKNTQTRVNIYYIPEKVVTVNCVPIITADYFARNGVIHLVDKVLPEPSRTVADIIAGDAQFSVLKGMLSRAGLVQTLRNPNKTFTVFAPADSSFTKPWLEKEEENDRCITNLMKHHIIDHVICSQAIPHFAKSLNMIGELLSLSRDEHNKLYVDDIQVVVKDLVATNGVVHIIDGLLSTRQAKTVTQVLEKYGLSEFLSLIEMANLGSYFDSMDNVTFFIPSDDSLKTISPSHLESFMYDAEALREVLLYHVGIGQTEINAPDQVLDSRLPNTSIRIQVHSAYPYATPQILVQCATILSPGNKICGGTLHVINKVLLPPKLSLIQLLENIDGFSTLVLLLRVTGLERRLRDTSVRYTLLAPTDDAFHQMGQGPLFRLLEDLSLAADLVKMHIISGTVCCSQLKADLMIGRGQVRAIDGSSLRMERTREGTLTVADAMIVDCDIMATNGAIHMVDSVLLQKSGNGVYIRI